MAYGIDEYPFTSMHDTNLLQVLCLAAKLDKEYSGLNSKLTQMETKVNGFQSYIDQKVQSQVTADIATYQAKVDGQLAEMKNEISTFKSQINNQQSQYEAQIDKKIEDFRKQVNEGIEQHRKEYEAAMQAMRQEIADKTTEMKNTITALVAETNQKVDKLTNDTHEHVHKILAFMRADFNQLKAEITNRLDKFENDANVKYQGMSNVIDAVVSDVAEAKDKAQKAVEEANSFTDTLYSINEHIDSVYEELMERITTATSPSGYLTNPKTGEVLKADDVIQELYRDVLYNHIPDVETMGAWSPKVSEMEGDTTPLRDTSVNYHSWYETPRSPVTGKRETLRGQASTLHRSPVQKDNTELKNTTISDLKEQVKDYGDFKNTDPFTAAIQELTTKIEEYTAKVDGFEERITALESPEV